MSIWDRDVKFHNYPSLEEDKVVDTLIIGGGLTGIQILYFLRNQKSVMLVEGNQIGFGVSKNTTGKINYLQESTLGYLIIKKQMTKAKMYLASQLEGIHTLLEIISNENISCNLENVTSYLVTKKNSYVGKIKKIEEFLKSVSISVESDYEDISKDFCYGIGVKDTYVFHPLKYLNGLLKRINHPIYENTRIKSIQKTSQGYLCKTISNHFILAKNVVVACHYPFFLFPYFMPIKTTIEKSYLTAYPVSKNKKYTYITMESPSESVRFYEDNDKVYQIYLNGSHKTSVKQNDLKHFDDVCHNVSSESVLWSNVDILTYDHIPFIGEIKKDLYLATGFQTWGMINSVLGAKIISDHILLKKSPYQSLFSPRRSFVLQSIYSIPYTLYNAYSFIKSMWYKKSWYSKNLSFFHRDGKLVASYTDEFGHKHFVHPVCPHMKCHLIFNEVEKTWDCPCHSSRFDIDGNVVKGPSKYSISCK